MLNSTWIVVNTVIIQSMDTCRVYQKQDCITITIQTSNSLYLTLRYSHGILLSSTRCLCITNMILPITKLIQSDFEEL